MAEEQKRGTLVKLTAETIDEATGEVVGTEQALVQLPAPEDMGIETEEGVLRGLGQ